MHCDKVTALNTRACKNRKFRYMALQQITSFIEDEYLSYLLYKMADRGSRVATALNSSLAREFLTTRTDAIILLYRRLSKTTLILEVVTTELMTALMKVTRTVKV